MENNKVKELQAAFQTAFPHAIPMWGSVRKNDISYAKKNSAP